MYMNRWHVMFIKCLFPTASYQRTQFYMTHLSLGEENCKQRLSRTTGKRRQAKKPTTKKKEQLY